MRHFVVNPGPVREVADARAAAEAVGDAWREKITEAGQTVWVYYAEERTTAHLDAVRALLCPTQAGETWTGRR